MLYPYPASAAWGAPLDGQGGGSVLVVLVAMCGVSAAVVLAIALVRWVRDPEALRWARIEQRARTREAAARAAARYASLPSITVAAPLVPFVPPAPPMDPPPPGGVEPSAA